MLLSLLFLWIHVSISKVSAAEFSTYKCGPNTTTSQSNTSYYSNLFGVLESLVSDKAVDERKFVNKSFGEAYGLYLCRNDILPNDCRNCLLDARNTTNRTCPFSKKAVFWKDSCMLRYADYSMFSNMETDPFVPECNKVNTSQQTSEQTRFQKAAMNLLHDLAQHALTNPEKLAFHEILYKHNETIYGYVQCTPDLSSSRCESCLKVSIDQLEKSCFGRLGARVLTPSCNVRFETYKFLQFQESSSYASGKRNIKPYIIPAIVFTTLISAAIVAIRHIRVTNKRGTMTFKESNDEDDRFKELRDDHQTFKDLQDVQTDESEIINEQSLRFDLGTIEAATNNFSMDNKVGEGGFGGVYKGVLSNGQEIAVKRLSKSSGQGTLEFKNEVVLLAKLQHRNLVKLLGFCLEAEEKILIYEYVHNHSLDYFLFDPTKQAQLDWSSRYRIIGGIARGMLYLHEDSRLRIVHRDLKASNVLLDGDMNPKISDFGTARIFYGNQTQAQTNKVVGTLGYMSPEYAMHGNFSVRSDVFSLGVVVLEIISGKRNIGLFESGQIDLLCQAWNKWKNGEPLNILDPSLECSPKYHEVLRCINIALLCVQEDAELRPSMASVVLMLNSYSIALPLPHNPPFILHKDSKVRRMALEVLNSNNGIGIMWPTDDLPITEVHPR